MSDKEVSLEDFGDLADLDLGEVGGGAFFAPSARGRKAGVPASFARDLTVHDIPDILAPEPVGAAVGAVARMRHTHHRIARLLATGMKSVRVSEITGFSQSWISTLHRDPAFGELLEYYKGQVEGAFLDVQERLATLGVDAVEELHNRLIENAESFSNASLMSLVEMTFDRSVAPKKGGPQSGPGGGVAAPIQLNISFTQSPHRGGDDIIEGEIVP
jgi:hypothetical protein